MSLKGLFAAIFCLTLVTHSFAQNQISKSDFVEKKEKIKSDNDRPEKFNSLVGAQLIPSFTIAENYPNPERNFIPPKDLISAGDVNGDGYSDFYYSVVAADETTSDPNDQVSKVIVYFGSENGLTIENSAMFRRDINFITDLTGDGKVEAISNAGGILKIYSSDSSGSFESPIVKEVLETKGFSYSINVKSYGDFNSDGLNDLIVFYRDSELESDSTAFYMIYGANSLGDIAIDTLYHPNGKTGEKTDLLYGDLEGDGKKEIIRSFSIRDPEIEKHYGISVFQLNDAGRLSLLGQDTLGTDVYDGNYSSINVDIADLNGDGNLEFLFENRGNLRFFSLSSDIDEFFTDTDSTMGFITSNTQEFIITDYSDPKDAEEVLVFGRLQDGSNGLKYLSFNSNYEVQTSEIQNEEYEITGLVRPFSRGDFFDINNDGIEDIVVEISNTNLFGYGFYLGNKTSTFQDFNSLEFQIEDYEEDQPMYVFSAGDLNDDDIDDFGIVYEHKSEVHLFFGKSFSNNLVPDLIVDEEDEAYLYDPVSGDINGDGISDLVISRSKTNADSNDASFSIYFGGADFDNIPEETIRYVNLYPNVSTGNISNIQIVGDINGDGFEDIMFTSETVKATTKVIFGGETLSSIPDLELPVFAVNFLGLGDFNEDGKDDFAIVTEEQSIEIYGGYVESNGESLSDDPYVTFTVPKFGVDGNYDMYNRFGHTLAAGDFDGDGINDLATTSVFHVNALTDAPLPGIQLFKGGAEADSVVDGSIYLLREEYEGLFFSGTQDTLDQNIGTIAFVPDQNGDGKGELLFAAYGAKLTNAGIYFGDDLDKMGADVDVLLRAPDKATGLGPYANNLYASRGRPAVGDFNNDGINDFILPQIGEINYLVDPTYIYVAGQNIVSNYEEITQVKDFKLHQNYPNPFNPTTTISYNLPSSGDVQLQVFDITGRLVSKVVDQRQNAGVYSINFDGTDLASGLYIYRLQVAGITLTRKMMLIK